MKYSSTLAFLFLQCFIYANAIAQNSSNTPAEGGGAYPILKNDATNPCITADEYQMIEERCAKNASLIKREPGAQSKTTATLFSWPLKTKNGFDDCGYYTIFNYVDQDLTTGIKDYNCGAVTYDGHQGNDIGITPFAFLKMDDDDVEIIAAAPGTIIDKADGNFDKNCAMGNLPANYVIIQHADGSSAMYWHMKKTSITTKPIGQTVVTGEYLGRVGSSGSSTGPHLHFEVWSGSTVATRKDAYSGPCNALNTNTWWVSQKPYTEPAIMHASVNTAVPVFPACPATEIPNEDSCFTPPGTAKFVFYLRNETTGKIANLRIVNPDGSTFSSWTHNSTTDYLASYWYWTKNLPTSTGIYRFETVYNNDTCTKIFKINCAALTVNQTINTADVTISPNPVVNELNISAKGIENGTYHLAVSNMLGQPVIKEDVIVNNNQVQKTISTAALPNGVYFLDLQAGENRILRKIMK